MNAPQVRFAPAVSFVLAGRTGISRAPRCAGAVLFVLLGALAPLAAPHPGGAAFPTGALVTRLPLSFLENRGQGDSRARYYLQGKDTQVYFSPGGLTFTLVSDAHAAARPVPPRFPAGVDPAPPRYALKLDFLDAAPHVKPVGQELAPGVASY